MKGKTFGTLALAIYLILIGAVAVFKISLGQLEILPPILAIAAGVLLLLGR